MQNITNTLNSTLSFSHFNSPFPGVIRHGSFRWNHTSSAAVAYRPSSLPTPWPLLVVGLGISLVQAFWTLVSNADRWSEHDDGCRRSTKKRILDWISIVISTIRTWTAFIRAIKAVASNSARSLSPTALFTMTMCMFPGIVRPEGIQGWLMGLNILLAYTSFELVFFARYRGDADYYGSLYLTGGHCPDIGCAAYSSGYVGCSSDPYLMTTDGAKHFLNKDFGLNMIGSAEFVLGLVYNLTLVAIELVIMAGLLFLLFCLPFLIWGAMKQLRTMRWKRLNMSMKWSFQPLNGNPKAWKDKIVYLFQENEDDNPYDTREMRRQFAILAILVVGLTSVVIVPVTESQQTRQKTLQIQDSFGPWTKYYSGNSDNLNGSYEVNGSWSDCFDVPIVHDRLGFLEFWWDQNKAKPLDWLAAM